MSRFIFIDEGREMINADCIAKVIDLDNGLLRIVFTDNTTYEVDEENWNEIAGHESIKAIYPCQNLAVLLDIDGSTIPFPVNVLALTDSGQLRPMDEALCFLDEKPNTRFIGYESYDLDED